MSDAAGLQKQQSIVATGGPSAPHNTPQLFCNVVMVKYGRPPVFNPKRRRVCVRSDGVYIMTVPAAPQDPSVVKRAVPLGKVTGIELRNADRQCLFRVQGEHSILLMTEDDGVKRRLLEGLDGAMRATGIEITAKRKSRLSFDLERDEGDYFTLAKPPGYESISTKIARRAALVRAPQPPVSPVTIAEWDTTLKLLSRPPDVAEIADANGIPPQLVGYTADRHVALAGMVHVVSDVGPRGDAPARSTELPSALLVVTPIEVRIVANKMPATEDAFSIFAIAAVVVDQEQNQIAFELLSGVRHVVNPTHDAVAATFSTRDTAKFAGLVRALVERSGYTLHEYKQPITAERVSDQGRPADTNDAQQQPQPPQQRSAVPPSAAVPPARHPNTGTSTPTQQQQRGSGRGTPLAVSTPTNASSPMSGASPVLPTTAVSEEKLKKLVHDFRNPMGSVCHHFTSDYTLLARQCERLTSRGSWVPRVVVVTNFGVLICLDDGHVKRSFDFDEVTELHITRHWQAEALTFVMPNSFDCVIKQHSNTLKSLTMADVAAVFALNAPHVQITHEHAQSKDPLHKVVSPGRNIKKTADFRAPTWSVDDTMSQSPSRSRYPASGASASTTPAAADRASAATPTATGTPRRSSDAGVVPNDSEAWASPGESATPGGGQRHFDDVIRSRAATVDPAEAPPSHSTSQRQLPPPAPSPRAGGDASEAATTTTTTSSPSTQQQEASPAAAPSSSRSPVPPPAPSTTVAPHSGDSAHLETRSSRAATPPVQLQQAAASAPPSATRAEPVAHDGPAASSAPPPAQPKEERRTEGAEHSGDVVARSSAAAGNDNSIVVRHADEAPASHPAAATSSYSSGQRATGAGSSASTPPPVGPQATTSRGVDEQQQSRQPNAARMSPPPDADHSRAPAAAGAGNRTTPQEGRVAEPPRMAVASTTRDGDRGSARGSQKTPDAVVHRHQEHVASEQTSTAASGSVQQHHHHHHTASPAPTAASGDQGTDRTQSHHDGGAERPPIAGSATIVASSSTSATSSSGAAVAAPRGAVTVTTAAPQSQSQRREEESTTKAASSVRPVAEEKHETATTSRAPSAPAAGGTATQPLPPPQQQQQEQQRSAAETRKSEGAPSTATAAAVESSRHEHPEKEAPPAAAAAAPSADSARQISATVHASDEGRKAASATTMQLRHQSSSSSAPQSSSATAPVGGTTSAAPSTTVVSGQHVQRQATGSASATTTPRGAQPRGAVAAPAVPMLPLDKVLARHASSASSAGGVASTSSVSLRSSPRRRGASPAGSASGGNRTAGGGVISAARDASADEWTPRPLTDRSPLPTPRSRRGGRTGSAPATPRDDAVAADHLCSSRRAGVLPDPAVVEESLQHHATDAAGQTWRSLRLRMPDGAVVQVQATDALVEVVRQSKSEHQKSHACDGPNANRIVTVVCAQARLIAPITLSCLLFVLEHPTAAAAVRRSAVLLPQTAAIHSEVRAAATADGLAIGGAEWLEMSVEGFCAMLRDGADVETIAQTCLQDTSTAVAGDEGLLI